MKRLLCIVGSMNAGGAETFLMKIYRALDKSQYQMDFVVAIREEGFYDKEIKNMGGKIYHISPKSQGILKNFFSIRKIVKENKYKYVLRTSQHSLSALELLSARLGGAKVTIFRSSNSNTTSTSKKELILHKICMFMPRLFANVRIAPSTEAAEFMFGKNCIKTGRAFLLNNAVDIELFSFDADARLRYRKEFGIGDGILIGHVGRFNQQKNHAFLIDIFNEIVTRNIDAKLILIGTGELENDVLEKVKKYKLEERVIFTGVRSDVSKIYSAMDVFLFPSLYEGMPNTVIEAQTSGLKCLVSDAITQEAAVTDAVYFSNINDDCVAWSNKLLEIVVINKEDRSLYAKYMEVSGYSIKDSSKKFVASIFKS